jgi:hypothetical protein
MFWNSTRKVPGEQPAIAEHHSRWRASGSLSNTVVEIAIHRGVKNAYTNI